MHCYSAFVTAVKGEPKPRTRRAEKAEETSRRIVAAARELFTDPGYSSTTIQAVAREADVAVETIYSKFRNKQGLLDAVLGTNTTGAPDAKRLFEMPEFRAIAECTDQREQLRMLAHMDRVILERVASSHRIMATAGSREAQDALDKQIDYRIRAQRMYIDLLLNNGPLREGLSADDAGATYASLAHPMNFNMLTVTLGWSHDKFEEWMAETTERLLLDPA